MLEILPAKIENSELLLKLIKELAVFENFPYEISVTKTDIENNLFKSNPDAEAIICYVNKEACGFAVFYYTFSTATGRRGLHLDDLYIRPEFQGQGIGKKVLRYLSRLAVEQHCARFEWWALKTNDPAIKFYQKIGAKKLDELCVFRMEEGDISELASKSI
ncbi:GNAT family N-acetyltransferase [Marinomonas mediterranea]|jgi:Acetyltransferases|uniref:GCN5-related N-acetyltransferase n=1 Tax=Marinomonas mediterranea (strain ATCC 700492 / JCM 21426 / NBRC 103028 / MMB-1) TaxID=717774 RepID=F2JUZ4_MARM1|nr:GNAT family N-acetyltransferase [Marinomonas mediterranea]ADZ91648.1 GCN5-related N-acetyltransferase [Marinomonas mediterranea MMB-1]WCN17749.1 GNAT family N-acetyltransferase [Marinomonas mediterranea MMB-1]